MVCSIHTILPPGCHSAIRSVQQQPEGTGVAYKQWASQEFNCNPVKQMWCDIQHSACLAPVICPIFMALQRDDSFLDNHVCIPLSLINTLTHACGDSIFTLCSLTFYSAPYEVWTICHRTRNVATMSASMFHWAVPGDASTQCRNCWTDSKFCFLVALFHVLSQIQRRLCSGWFYFAACPPSSKE